MEILTVDSKVAHPLLFLPRISQYSVCLRYDEQDKLHQATPFWVVVACMTGMKMKAMYALYLDEFVVL